MVVVEAASTGRRWIVLPLFWWGSSSAWSCLALVVCFLGGVIAALYYTRGAGRSVSASPVNPVDEEFGFSKAASEVLVVERGSSPVRWSSPELVITAPSAPPARRVTVGTANLPGRRRRLGSVA